MKYDVSLVGERVVDLSNKEGVITKVANGNVTIKFEGDRNEGTFLFDPFIGGNVKFKNEELQKMINDEIDQIYVDQLNIVNASISSRKSEETYYITKDRPDGSKEKIYGLKCDQEQAFVVFGFVVREQQKEYRASGCTIPWRIVRLYNSKTGEQICQES